MLITLKLDYSHLMSVAEAIYYIISLAVCYFVGGEGKCLYFWAASFCRIWFLLFHICLV